MRKLGNALLAALVVGPVIACSPAAAPGAKSDLNGGAVVSSPPATDGDPTTAAGASGIVIAGGQTGDFGGSSSIDCHWKMEKMTPEIATAFRVDEIRSAAAGAFHSSLKWVVHEDWVALDCTAEPTGFDAHTTIDGKVTLGDPVHFTDEQTAGAGCSDWVGLPADVSFETADGALKGSTTGGMLRINSRQAFFSSITAQIDSADLQGALYLHLDPMDLFTGGWGLFINVFPDTSERRGGIAIGLQGLHSSGGRPIEALWPDDDCDQASVPIDADARPAGLDHSVDEVYAEWKTAVASVGAQTARWLDGSTTQVNVDLGELKSVCLAGEALGKSASFQTDAKLTTSDGRVNAILVAGTISLASDVAVSEFSLRSRVDPNSQAPALSPDQFANQTGISGIDPKGKSWIATNYEVIYEHSADGTKAHGALGAFGQPACEPQDAPCKIDPTRAETFDCLQWSPAPYFGQCRRGL